MQVPTLTERHPLGFEHLAWEFSHVYAYKSPLAHRIDEGPEPQGSGPSSRADRARNTFQATQRSIIFCIASG